MKRLLFFIATMLAAAQTHAGTLITPSFTVKIDVQCEEGNVTCDKVGYLGTSRKTGKSLSLRGKTLHGMCADGVTPCRFLGYAFKNGDTSYLVLDEGTLLVKRGDEVLLKENGKWD